MMSKKRFMSFILISLVALLPLACLTTSRTVEPWVPPALATDSLEAQTPGSVSQDDTANTQQQSANLDAPAGQSTEDSGYLQVQEEYIVQSGDSLKEIAEMFGVNMDQLLIVNEITNPDLIYVGQVLLIPSSAPLQSGPDFIIIPDSEFIYSPAAANFSIAEFLKQQNGYINQYAETIDKRTYTGVEILTRIATDYSINPRILLAVVEYQTGWITNPAKPGEDQLLYPLGYRNEKRKGLFSQLNWAAGTLNYGYYTLKVNGISGWILTDGAYVPISPAINPGTAAIQHFMAQLYGSAQWEKTVSSEGVYQTYLGFFGLPSAYTYDPLIPAGLTQPPLSLPIEVGTTWSFTGGPHSAWGSGSAWGALDFAPPGVPLGCVVTDAWAIAVADGLIVRSGEGSVLLDLDGDGVEQTGWVILYLHIDSYQRIPAGTYVHQGDYIGHPSCEGGVSFGTHLHLARKYNGEWIPADQQNPFNLDGWISEGTGVEYDGYLRRGTEVVEAWDDYVEENQITH